MNLISNAIYAVQHNNKREKKITLHTYVSDHMVCISVKDNGTGIPAGLREKVFDPFFSTKETGKGTGLGLSISYGIIHEHKGQITFESEEGIGTDFLIQLPIKQNNES